MDAFENIVSQYLEEEGYWVRQSVKVPISKDDKKYIGLPSMPKPEIDLVALKAKSNTLLLIEVKSYLDSPGVRFDALTGENKKLAKRYRLFTDKKFREVVTKRLLEHYLDKGLINEDTEVNYVLAAGKIYSNDEEKIREYLTSKGWGLIPPNDIKEKVKELALKSWEDNIVTITAKLILRG